MFFKQLVGKLKKTVVSTHPFLRRMSVLKRRVHPDICRNRTAVRRRRPVSELKRMIETISASLQERM